MDFRDYDTRLAAYALILDEHDRVLLARWNEGDQPRWTMPGGGVEFDETPAEGAVRELQEETGYDVELLGLLGGTRTSSGPGTGSIRTTDEARWIPLNQVPSLSRVSLVDAALALRSERI